ncbi:alkaline phosphatase [Aliikangiella maris]|uniref:Alkaline phosphatase n=2 Tax=Aliikangiella maris TaxID=3162458 RepID=A0ABV2BS52_9GAMM
MINRVSKKLLGIVLILVTWACANAQSTLTSSNKSHSKPKNIILFIGDGMGPAHIKALRMFQDNPATPLEEPLVFDPYLVGSVNTNAADSKENITDSAASATAYASAQKSYNGAISVDLNAKPLRNLFEKARIAGKATGLVVTSQLTHATPAAFYAHIDDREKENAIADQLIDNRYEQMPLVDIALGGGLTFFQRHDRNILEEFSQLGFEIVNRKEQLQNATGQRLIGVFANKGLDKYWDRTINQPSLADMTKAALDKLTVLKPNGFVLIVEGSQIDWAAHANDVLGVISEMQDFERAAQVAIDYTKASKDTLMVITADHETGGLSIGAKTSGKHYQWNVDFLRQFSLTPAFIATKVLNSKAIIREVEQSMKIELSQAEKQSLKKVNLQDWDSIREKIAKIISQRSFTGWTTQGHTGGDVALYALGAGSERLRGHMDNTQVGDVLAEYVAE